MAEEVTHTNPVISWRLVPHGRNLGPFKEKYSVINDVGAVYLSEHITVRQKGHDN